MKMALHSKKEAKSNPIYEQFVLQVGALQFKKLI